MGVHVKDNGWEQVGVYMIVFGDMAKVNYVMREERVGYKMHVMVREREYEEMRKEEEKLDY